MRILHIDAESGVTGTALLGALLDVGASLEAVQHAVGSLGVGNVRITLGRVRRGDAVATSIRLRAPEQTPSVDTWERVGNLLEYAALEEDVRRRAAACVARLADATARARGAEVAELRLDQPWVLDAVAEIVGSCAALASLAPDRVTCGPAGPPERTDATGSALVAELAAPVPERPRMTVERDGAGATAAEPPRADVLRVYLGTSPAG